MNDRSFRGRRTWILAMVLGVAGVVMPAAPATAQPILASEMVQSALQGFGDRQNSHAWGISWWRNKLYIGTGRSTHCVQQATLEFYLPDSGNYPPLEEDLDCAPNAYDLPLQAEIWRWTPETDTWEMLYRSPNDVPIQGTVPQKYTARDIGFRAMQIFREADGTEALYVSGVSSRGGQQGTGFAGPVPPPRILRSVDGETFQPIPQDPGTFMGDLMLAGFRSLVSYKGKMYVLASVGLLGHGVVLEAAHPEQGNDAFRQISPPGMTFFEISKYNGHLFLGSGVNPAADDTPFSLLKTNATGDPYTFTTVIPEGAFKKQSPSAAVISMQKFKGHLFVGSDRELFRVNPDDSWDLVVGAPRSIPDGRRLEPLSGFNIGFDNLFTIHMWRMTKYGGALYIGTQDQSAKWRNVAGAELLAKRMGTDLYATTDGWQFTMITRNGFGDFFNNGVRNFAGTPYGLFLGTANHYYGTKVFRGVPAPRPIAAPQRPWVEDFKNAVLLSWEPSAGATQYRVFRDTGFEDPVEIASVPATAEPVQTYLDSTTNGFASYHYYVEAEDALGQRSVPSAMMPIPYAGHVPTFTSLRFRFERWGAAAVTEAPMGLAKDAVKAGDFDQALSILGTLRGAVLADLTIVPHRAQDADYLLGQFIRRVGLAKDGALPVQKLLR